MAEKFSVDATEIAKIFFVAKQGSLQFKRLSAIPELAPFCESHLRSSFLASHFQSFPSVWRALASIGPRGHGPIQGPRAVMLLLHRFPCVFNH
jgi:hypothetical protein